MLYGFCCIRGARVRRGRGGRARVGAGRRESSAGGGQAGGYRRAGDTLRTPPAAVLCSARYCDTSDCATLTTDHWRQRPSADCRHSSPTDHEIIGLWLLRYLKELNKYMFWLKLPLSMIYFILLKNYFINNYIKHSYDVCLCTQINCIRE